MNRFLIIRTSFLFYSDMEKVYTLKLIKNALSQNLNKKEGIMDKLGEGGVRSKWFTG